MGIVVGHDVNPGLLPYEAAYAMQLGQNGRQGNLQAQAAAENQRLQPQGGGAGLMARHNASQAQEGAGFDWQTPIVITHPDQSQDPNSGMRYDTLYQSQGADPLANAAGVAGASSGFGKLGSREQYIVDQNSRIDPNNPLDRANVGKLADAMPYGTNQIGGDVADQLFSPQSRETNKYAENLRIKAGEQPFGVTKEGDALDRQYAADMAKYRSGQDALKNDAAKATGMYEADTAENTDEAGNGVGAEQRVDTGRVPLNPRGAVARQQVIGQMAALSEAQMDEPEKAPHMKLLQENLDKIEKNPIYAAEMQRATDAHGYEQVIDAHGIARYTPAAVAQMRADKQAEQVQQSIHDKQKREEERQAAAQKLEDDRKADNEKRDAQRVEAAKVRYEERRHDHQNKLIEDAAKEVKKDAKNKFQTLSDEEVVNKVRERMKIYDQLNPPPVEQAPDGSAKIQSDSQHATLPVGTVYTAPDGTRRIKRAP